jgi:hypothetical protein
LQSYPSIALLITKQKQLRKKIKQEHKKHTTTLIKKTVDKIFHLASTNNPKLFHKISFASKDEHPASQCVASNYLTNEIKQLYDIFSTMCYLPTKCLPLGRHPTSG